MAQSIQHYNDGIVKIYDVSNSAAAGQKPVAALALKETMRYDERTVGMSRYYAAMQANVKISHVLRCPRLRSISTQDVVIPNDGAQYGIKQIQYPEDVVPPSMDLTLEAIMSPYTIYQEAGEDEP